MIYGFDIRYIMEYDISNMIDMWCIYDIYDIYYIYLCIYIYILVYDSNPSFSISQSLESPRGCHGSNELHEDDIPWEPTIRRQPPPNIDLDPPRVQVITFQRFNVSQTTVRPGEYRSSYETQERKLSWVDVGGWFQPIWKVCNRQIGSWNPKFRDENKENIWVAST